MMAVSKETGNRLSNRVGDTGFNPATLKGVETCNAGLLRNRLRHYLLTKIRSYGFAAFSPNDFKSEPYS